MAVSGRAGSGQSGGSTAAPTPNDAIRDLVDTALDSEDAAPLVRLIVAGHRQTEVQAASDSQIASTRHGWLQVRTVFDSSTAASARTGLPLEEQAAPENDDEDAAEDELASGALCSALQPCCKLRAYSAERPTNDTIAVLQVE